MNLKYAYVLFLPSGRNILCYLHSNRLSLFYLSMFRIRVVYVQQYKLEPLCLWVDLSHNVRE